MPIPCSEKSPKARNPDYYCNEKTKRWNKKPKNVVPQDDVTFEWNENEKYYSIYWNNEDIEEKMSREYRLNYPMNMGFKRDLLWFDIILNRFKWKKGTEMYFSTHSPGDGGFTLFKVNKNYRTPTYKINKDGFIEMFCYFASYYETSTKWVVVWSNFNDRQADRQP